MEDSLNSLTSPPGLHRGLACHRRVSLQVTKEHYPLFS